MKAIILAGGKGTRLGDLTKDVPKPMVLVAGKPILHHQVDLLKKYGITDILFIVNHLRDSIVDYFGDGKKWGVNISYYLEKEPLGTSGALKEIESDLKEEFLLLYGDVMINMNLKRLIDFHHRKKSDCTLVLHPNDHPYDSDLVEIDKEGRVNAFHSKPHDPDRYYRNMVNAGLYLLHPKVLKLYGPGKQDFGKDIFPEIFSQLNMYGYNTSEYLKDMGTPDRLKKVTADYLSQKIEKSNYDYPQKAIFLDRDGVINDDKDLIHKVEDFELYPFSAEAIKKINQSDYLGIVVTNQSVVARNLCTEEGLDAIHKKMDTELGKERVWLDALYYCPHHPDKGYPGENPVFKITCDCRKPEPGMVLKASNDFNISLHDSFLIGDSETDILCAQNAGITSVGVRTGKGLKKSTIDPDFFFDNIKEAVEFIIDDPYRTYFEDIFNKFEKKGEINPFIITIAGNTRSGKSTLAGYLTYKFQKAGIRVMKISLDNWLLPSKEERDRASDVYGRYQTQQMEEDFNAFFAGKKITAPGYHHHPDRKKETIPFELKNNRVVVIEGVVGLSIPVLREKADVRIYKEVEDEQLKHKMTTLYRWKGYEEKTIEEIYKKRVQDEYTLIKKDIQFADIVI